MKRFWRLLIVFVFVVFAVSSSFSSEEQKGLEVIKKVYQAYRDLSDETEKIEAKLITGDDFCHKTLRFIRQIKYFPDAEDKIFLEILYPPRDKGRALLIWRHRGNDDMWMWMTTMRKIRRISYPEKKSLWGMDLTYQDVSMLTGEEWWDYKYTIEKETAEYVILKAKPKPTTNNTLYGFRKIWIQKNNLFPAKYKYFNKRGELMKIQEATDLYPEGKVWRWRKIEVKNLENGHKTILYCQEREINKNLSPRIFSLRNLQRQKW
jgi:hypothetical protein